MGPAGSRGSRGVDERGVFRVSGESPRVVEIHARVSALPAIPEGCALGEPAAPGLVQELGGSLMGEQGMAVGLCVRSLILPGFAAVGAPQYPAQFYADHDEVRVRIRERDSTDVGGPGTGWEAPGGRGGEIPHALQLAPGSTPITADEQGRRLRAGVDCAIGGRDGDGGDPRVFDL